VTEGVVAADACKSSVSEYVASINSLPADITKAGCDGFVTSHYVATLTYNANGAITVTYKSVGTGVDGSTYQLKPADTSHVSEGQITAWTCTSSTVESQLLPAACR
jgi:type IV pilus assembly protein PilA